MHEIKPESSQGGGELKKSQGSSHLGIVHYLIHYIILIILFNLYQKAIYPNTFMAIEALRLAVYVLPDVLPGIQPGRFVQGFIRVS